MKEEISVPINNFQPNLLSEFKERKSNWIKSIKKIRALKTIYPRDYNFPSFVEKLSVNIEPPSFSTLKTEYWELNQKLREQNPQTQRTPSEQYLRDLIAVKTKREVYQSIWIGSYCFDLFIPNIRSSFKHPNRVMRGLAIEVDGDSHNFEGKMKKDNQKGIEALFLGIGETHIKNWDFNKKTALDFRLGVSGLKSLDSRERRRLWRRIFCYTIAIHFPEEQFFELFQIEY